MSDIPEEIIFNNILWRLPVKSLIRFSCVRKSWCQLLTNPNFIKRHLKHANEQSQHLSVMLHDAESVYTMDYSTTSNNDNERIEIDYPFEVGSLIHRFRIWGYCNGLFCISTAMSEKFIILWNPSTREYKNIPPAPFQCAQMSFLADSFEYGLWCDCKIDDYKVVSFRSTHREFLEVMVYTLGSNSWGSYQRISYIAIYPGTERGRMPINGALHWLAQIHVGSGRVIVCFDVVEESFKEMQLPDCLNKSLSTHLTALGGSLGVLNYAPRSDLDVWEMKEYGVVDSWTKVFTIIGRETPVGSLSMQVPSYYNHQFLLEEGCDANWAALQAPIYVGSLVSLNSGTYATTTMRKEKMLWQERENKKRKREEDMWLELLGQMQK